jgi:hypothetical protein
MRVGPAMAAAGTGSSNVRRASDVPDGESASAPPPETQLVVTCSRLAAPPDAIIGGQSLSASNRQKRGLGEEGAQKVVEAPLAMTT